MSTSVRAGRSLRRPLLALLALGLFSPLVQADLGPATVHAVMRVEIPAGSALKYEFDQDGVLFVDRFLPGNEVYPANYGGLPGTLAGDGDPLDALVLTRSPLLPGAHIRFRPIGVLRMRDGGQEDDKLIGVPVTAVDADWAGVTELEQLPDSLRQRIASFFLSYKQDGAKDNPVQLAGWGNAQAAKAMLLLARKRYGAAAVPEG